MIIRIISQNQGVDVTVREGLNLMSLLCEQGYILLSPCGGRGTCGKCFVEIDGHGPVLSCQTILSRDMAGAIDPVQEGEPNLVIRLPSQGQALILTDGLMPHLPIDPLIKRLTATISPPSLENQQADDDRFAKATGYQIPFAILAQLPDVLAHDAGRVRFIGRTDTRTVVRFLNGKTKDQLTETSFLPGVAIDIGTTTLAAYLFDLHDGKRLASTAMINPQSRFGADVITRITKASNSSADLIELQDMILHSITALCEKLFLQANESVGLANHVADLALLTLTGNTTMLHLLAGLPPRCIAASPFNPVSISTKILTAAELKLTAFPHALCVLLPSVSAYVGADITAGIIALGLEKSQHETSLLIDIGTNGEIVLRSGDLLTACSTAAGPAFEGAEISCGMSGITGAIDHIWMDGDELCYSVINAFAMVDKGGVTKTGLIVEKPIGICGSGLIDALALMLETGIIDETGRIGADRHHLTESMLCRLTTVNQQPAFILADTTETGNGQPVLLTQKDIRMLQNAKAAIAAGIQVLLQREAVDPASVKAIYLAGGFGQYLNIRSARTIGLIPECLAGRVISAGNTAAMGAIGALLNRDFAENAQLVARSVLYRELSTDPLFTDIFVESMLFPEGQP